MTTTSITMCKLTQICSLNHTHSKKTFSQPPTTIDHTSAHITSAQTHAIHAIHAHIDTTNLTSCSRHVFRTPDMSHFLPNRSGNLRFSKPVPSNHMSKFTFSGIWTWPVSTQTGLESHLLVIWTCSISSQTDLEIQVFWNLDIVHFHSNRPQFIFHDIRVTYLHPNFSESEFSTIFPKSLTKFSRFALKPHESDGSWNFCHIAPIKFCKQVGWVGSSRILSLW